MSSKIDMILSDYQNVNPVNNSYYIPYIYQQKLPKIRSYDYYRFLELLKYLESKQQFNKNDLILFT